MSGPFRFVAKSTLREKIAILEQENESLRLAVHDKAVRDVLITDMAVVNGSLSVTTEGGLMHLFAESFAKTLDEYSAENYVEVQAQSKTTGKRYSLILQRCEMKTPHEKRVEAEQESARLRLALTDARAQMKRDVLAAIHGAQTPEGYDWSERGVADEHTMRIICAIEAL